jgi:secernin
MAGDVMVALGPATADRQTLFAHNCSLRAEELALLHRRPGKEFAPGERICTPCWQLPQARRTRTVLASRKRSDWGYLDGLNDQGLALGSVGGRTRCSAPDESALQASDLVRLVLERCDHARQGVDLLTQLIEEHGQRAGPVHDLAGDGFFLLADRDEAFLVETSGRRWACQEVLRVRAASNVCTIHQDWDHISPGLAQDAISHGWWRGDGSKLDFAEALAECPTGDHSALRRWGRATMLLEQQSGHIDVPFLRRLLGDHYEGTHFERQEPAQPGQPVAICQHAAAGCGTATGVSVIMELGIPGERLPCAWCAFGPGCSTVYLPVFIQGELPDAGVEQATELDPARWHGGILGRGGKTDPALDARLAALQARLDGAGQQFAARGAKLAERGSPQDLDRQATAFLDEQCQLMDELASATTQLNRASSAAQPARSARTMSQQGAG